MSADNSNFAIRKKVEAEVPEPPEEIRHAAAKPFTLFVHDFVINGVRSYLNTDLGAELGGVLFGRRYRTGDREVVEIETYESLPSQDRGRLHWTFDGVAIEAMYRARGNHPGLEIVGWFHSHPKIGDPFMSASDHDMHRRLFPKAWMISMVVGVGEWATPVGFWRLVGGDLHRVEDYFVRMVKRSQVGDADRAYLKASYGAGISGPVSLERPRALLHFHRPALDAGIVERIDFELARQTALPTSSTGVQLLRLSVSAAGALGNALQPLAKADEFINELSRSHFLADRAVRVIASDHLGDEGFFIGERPVTYKRASQRLCLADLQNNIVIPFTLDSKLKVHAGAAAENSRIWLLTDDSCLVLLHLPSGDDHDGGFKNQVCDLSQLAMDLLDASADSEVMTQGTKVFVRSGKFVHVLEEGEANGRVTLGLARSWNGARWRSIALIRRSKMSGEAVAVASDGELHWLLDLDGQVLSQRRLAAPLVGFDIRQAMETSLGLWLLMKGSRQSVLVLLDGHGQPLAYYHPDEDTGDFRSILMDGENRIFVQTHGEMRLLTDTGGPAPAWHCARGPSALSDLSQ